MTPQLQGEQPPAPFSPSAPPKAPTGAARQTPPQSPRRLLGGHRGRGAGAAAGAALRHRGAAQDTPQPRELREARGAPRLLETRPPGGGGEGSMRGEKD